MIPRLKGAITHGHDIKLSGEDSEDAATCWRIRPSAKAKSFKEDPRDIPTYGLGNRPNPKNNPAGIEVQD